MLIIYSSAVVPCVILTVLFVFSAAVLIAGGVLFTPQQTTTGNPIIIPDVTSTQIIPETQSNTIVVLLGKFTSENYSSFTVSMMVAELRALIQSDVSSKIWITQALNIVSNTYSSKDIILTDTYTTDFYALAGSTFNVSFPSLSGSNSMFALVQLIETNGSVLESQSVKPSNDSQSVTFTLEISGLVELRIINKFEGLNGTFDYTIMIREILLKGAEYMCTVNSRTTCKGMSVYENNYILAEMTLKRDFFTVIYVFTTLVGKEKLGPIETTRPNEALAIVFVLFSVAGLLAAFVLCLFWCKLLKS